MFDPKLIFIGLGNPFRGDDGIGISCVTKITQHFPNVRTYTEIDHDIDEIIQELIQQKVDDTVVFIDAVDFGGKPGNYKWIDDISLFYPTISTHEVAMKFYFELLQKSSIKCVMLAIQPEMLGFEPGLTPPMHEFIENRLINQITIFCETHS